MSRYSATARRVGSHECDTMRRLYPDEVQHVTGLPCIMTLKTSNAYLHFGGPKEKYRPYLVLTGEPVGFEGDFPGNISKLAYDRAIDRVPMEYVYELSRKNLADMVAKGLYEPGFEVPEVIKHNTWYLPVNAELYHAEVTFGEGDAARKSSLIFIRPQDGSYQDEENSLICSDEGITIDGKEIPASGYTVHEYFNAVLDKEEEAEYDEDGFLKESEDYLEDVPDDAYKGYENALDGTQTPDQFLMTEEEQAMLEASQSMVEETKEVPEVDPVAYDAMKKAADEQYREREEQRKRTLMEEAREEAIQGEESELIQEEAFSEESGFITGEDDEAAAKKRSATFNNQAENIDTPAEVALQGKSLHPGAAQLVDDGVIEQTQEMIDERNANRRVDADFLMDDENPDVAPELG